MAELLKYQIEDLTKLLEDHGATKVWAALKEDSPIQYNMLLLASLEMQAKELENLKGTYDIR